MKKMGFTIKYRCESCDKLHQFEDDAAACCTSVDAVYVCDECKQPFDQREDFAAHVCEGKPAPEWVEGSLCLCGATLESHDYRPSMLLGAQVMCSRCREKLIAGTPAGEAIAQSFQERGIEVR